MPAHKKNNRPIIAAVDLGSNSFHLVIARPTQGRLQVLDHLRERVQLGAGLDRNDRLTKAAQSRALACLKRFRQRLDGAPVAQVRAVGTQTLRRARDAQAFIARAQRTLGHPIEIIAGREEARLIYLGVAHTGAADARRRLVVDIGGGSTELIVGEGLRPLQMESLQMGCVSFTRRFFADGGLRPKQLGAAEIAAQLELEPFGTPFRGLGWLGAVGSSGTVRAVAGVVQAAKWCTHGITATALARLYDRLAQARHIDRVVLPALSAERRPVFAAGVVILRAVFSALGIERMEVSAGALREGVIFDLVGRTGYEDARRLTIDALCTRYQVDIAQATRVNASAQALLLLAARGWRWQGEHLAYLQHLVEQAARLHEIGLAVAHTYYHKHGAYLIENGDMPGFARDEQIQIAAIVRGHRRKFPLPAFAPVPAALRTDCIRLCVLLRIAVLLHRARTDMQLPRLHVAATPKGLRLKFPKAWWRRHPLTQEDLRQEALALRGIGFRLTAGES